MLFAAFADERLWYSGSDRPPLLEALRLFEDSSKALAELPTLTFVFGGGSKRRPQLDTS